MNNIKLSPKFIETILDDNFGLPDASIVDTAVYPGLGITFDEETFTFTKEPVSAGFTINETPCTFGEPLNGVIKNTTAISWDKAKEDWTKNGETIKYLGLYWRRKVDDVESQEPTYDYDLIAVLPLSPEETVLINERMVLEPGSIQIRLTNR